MTRDLSLPMRAIAIVCAAAGLVGGTASPASAQAIGAPTSMAGGLFGPRANRAAGATPQLNLTLDLGAGYDQAPESPDTGVPAPLFDQAGALGTGAANMYFHKGAARRVIEATGSVYYNRATVGLERVLGGEANLQWMNTLGARAGTTLSVNGASQPATLFNAYGPVAGQVQPGEVPPTSSTRGVTSQRWNSGQGGIGIYRNLTSRQRADLRYTIGYREPTSGPGLNNRTQGASYLHTWHTRETLSVIPAYRFNQNQQEGELSREVRLDTHTALASVVLNRGLPGGRGVSISGSVGLSYSRYSYDNQLFTFNLPTYSGYIRGQVRPGWRVALDAARDVSVLEGVSPEPFATNSVSARTEGILKQRLQFALTAAYSEGAGLATRNGAFDTAVGTAQIQYALARSWALYGSYSYYRYNLEAVQTQATLPNRFNLHSIRAGVNIWLPLYGRER